MPSLRETQQIFADGILGSPRVDEIVVSDWLKPEQRLAIYRYHYKASLREALASTFPVVNRLVGDNFFHGMADEFTKQYPPQKPCLAEYGRDFPDFIDSFQPAQSLPYLADIALFEWMMAESAHSAAYEGGAFYSRFPIGKIWETNQPSYQGDDTINLDVGGGWLVIEKAADKVLWRVLDLPPNAFDQ